MPEYVFVIPDDMDHEKLRHAALVGLRMSSTQYKRAKFQGEITLDGTRAMADARVKKGQVLRIFVPEKETDAPQAAEIPLHIVYEDEHLWVIDKPAPLPSAPSAKSDSPTLQNALYSHLGQPEGFVYRPVNRLDKGTSGLMMVAKDAHTQQLLQHMLHTADFVREYLAVVDGCPPEMEGVINLPIRKQDGATIRREVHPDGKEAKTFFTVMQKGQRSIIRLRLDTGRTHQIRVHMSHLGCPVTGDFLYGTEYPSLPGRFALHSCMIRLVHPITQQTMEWNSPLPAELALLVNGYCSISHNVHKSLIDACTQSIYTG